MKLYAVEWQGRYCGGVVVVMARNEKEAREKLAKSSDADNRGAANAKLVLVESGIVNYSWAE